MIEPEKRLQALKRLFPARADEWYQGKKVEHVGRAILASLAVDFGVGRSLDAEAARAHTDLLARHLPFFRRHPSLSGLTAEIDQFLRSPSVSDRQVARGLVARAIRELPFGPTEDTDLQAFRTGALEAEGRANSGFWSAYLEALQLETGAAAQAATVTEIGITCADLEAAIRQHLPEERSLRVEKLTAIVGGLSKQTILAETTGGVGIGDRVIVRLDIGVDWAGTPVAEEFATLTLLHEGGVKVPRPLLLHQPAGADRAYLVVEWAPGAPFGFIPALRSAPLCRQLAEQLGRTHSIPYERLEHVRGYSISTTEQVLKDIAQREQSWNRLPSRDPLIEYAIQWLRAHVAVTEGQRAMVHGDYAPHNILQQDETITSVLDWEFARVTNPAEDLGYVRGAAEALGSWEAFLDAYVKAGGIAPDPAVLNYFEVFACLMKIGILCELEAQFNDAPMDRSLAVMGSVLQNRQSLLCRLYQCLRAPMPR